MKAIIKKINKQIDKAVCYIKKKIIEYEKRGNKLNFNKFLEGKEFDRNKVDVIRIEDDFRFRIINDVDIQVFNKNSKNQQHAYYYLKDNYYAWFPKLVLDNGKAPTKWHNVLSRDGNYIYEYNVNNFDKNRNVDEVSSYYRVTFAKIQDPFTRKSFYRFVGIFQGIGVKNGERIYKLVDDSFQVFR